MKMNCFLLPLTIIGRPKITNSNKLLLFSKVKQGESAFNKERKRLATGMQVPKKQR
jgi:hypothetical protein